MTSDKMSESYYLGFDAGTQSVKVAVYSSDGVCVAQATNPTTIRYPAPRCVEMDADEYLRLTIKGMAQCTEIMRANGLDVGRIRSIMGDGIICGIVGVDSSGDAVTPFINYLDSRTQDDADNINNMKLDIWAQETGNAEASCMFPAMIARWFLSNGVRCEKFVHNAPYILSHLAGLHASDSFIDQGAMSGWGLGYDVTSKRWSDEQLDILGLNRSYMPRVVKAWDVVGHLTDEIAEMTGLPSGIPICGGAGDTMQSMIGCGITAPGMAVDVAGTCAMFCVSTDGINPSLSVPGSGLIFNSGTLDDTYFYWGFIRTGGLSLRWFKDSVYGGDVDYPDLSKGAASVPAGSRGVTFLPYLTGGYGDMNDASGAFLNMTLDTDRSVLWRSVLEAIGYDYMTVTDTYREAGVDLSKIVITEGGSTDDIWNQIKSDMIGSDAVVMKTRGGAVMTDCVTAAYAVGDVSDILDAMGSVTEVDRSFTPNRANTHVYRESYKARSVVMDGMKGVFPVLKGMNSIR